MQSRRTRDENKIKTTAKLELFQIRSRKSYTCIACIAKIEMISLTGVCGDPQCSHYHEKKYCNVQYAAREHLNRNEIACVVVMFIINGMDLNYICNTCQTLVKLSTISASIPL